MVRTKIEKTYPHWFEDDLLNEFDSLGRLIKFEAGDLLIDLNQIIDGMPILISGVVKILREDFDKGELLLYFLEKGDTCAMTMACCLGDKQSKIRAIAETNGEMVMIPITKMDKWLAKYPSWRKFIFDSYNKRLDEMLAAIDNLAFNNMNARLKKYLLVVAGINNGNLVIKTHQEIAYELNTSRVVISRLLKALEKEGFLELNRNEIRIL
ncbi:Crp/Fnr family transcriptional regulator [Vaginella massiliensis]|uniref:Crp/Fnr family transcriptional regulator n=1 Tax=Vaginella massiliensis TaxID=1816680 RepID=UPI000838CEA1|nr:Crp/Fnr family transcriptional regulator [Vaginella massiliensis]